MVEHCVSCAKGCGFNSQGTHVLMKMYNLNAIWIKVSDKCKYIYSYAFLQKIKEDHVEYGTITMRRGLRFSPFYTQLRGNHILQDHSDGFKVLEDD